MNKLKLTLPRSFGKGIFAKKPLRLVLEVTGSLFGLFLVILLVLLSRLAMGPLNLDFLTPEIEAAFKAPQAGLSASIEHTQLVWREWKRPFEIELVNVHFQKNQNPQWLKIEHISISIRLHRLLRGDVSLKHLRLYTPHILFEREETGEFSLGFGESYPTQEFSFEDIAPLLALGEPNPKFGKLNELSKISIINAHVLLKDEKNGHSWQLPKATFTLKRHAQGFHAQLSLSPHQGHGSLNMDITHRLGSCRFDVLTEFNHISFNKLIKKEKTALASQTLDTIPSGTFLDFFQYWDVPFHGKAHFAFIPKTFQSIEGVCDITIGKGELNLSGAKLQPLPVTSGNISLSFSPQGIEFKNISLLSKDTLLHLEGTLTAPSSSPFLLTTFLSPGQNLKLKGKIEDLFLDHLGALWPQEHMPLPRNWLTQNLRKGVLTQATFFLLSHRGEEGFVIDDLKGTLDGEGAEITYLEGLPPAQNVKAQATFDQKGFDIKILSGNLKRIQLQGGHIAISGLEGDHEALALEVNAKGPLSDILSVINQKPLEYASYGGIDPQKSKGEGRVKLCINFPLLASLQFKDVKIGLKGAFTQVDVERKITEDYKAHLTRGDLSIDLTQDQMVIQGKGTLNQLPSNLLYTHYFKKPAPYELKLQIGTVASLEDFHRLGFDYRTYAKGIARTNITYTQEHNKKSHLQVNLDTTPTTLFFKPLGWEKKAGEKGELSFSLVFKEGKLAKMKDLKMSSPSYSFQGGVIFGPNKAWKAIHLSEFKGPYTNTQVTLHSFGNNMYEASFKGQSLNLEKFLEYVNREENTADHSPTDIKLSGEVNQLRLGEGRVFQTVRASANLFLQGKSTTWKEVSLRAKAGKGTAHKGEMANVSGGILFDIKPGANNTQILEVRANDAGQFLKNLGIYDGIQGGYITVKAEAKTQQKQHGPYVGVFKLKQFNALEVPLLARFAALLSPMGIVNFFSANKTISMDRFECNFSFSEDLITVKKGIGKSMSLGFTVDGKLNRKHRLYALKGNIIPARFLNSILNNIPLIGPLLNGGEGEGLFGIAYSVAGTFTAPEISLNPLSILAPGFLRQLFQSIGQDE